MRIIVKPIRLARHTRNLKYFNYGQTVYGIIIAMTVFSFFFFFLLVLRNGDTRERRLISFRMPCGYYQ